MELLSLFPDENLSDLERVVDEVATIAVIFVNAPEGASKLTGREAMLNAAKGDRALLAFAAALLLAQLDDQSIHTRESYQAAFQNVMDAIDPDETVKRYKEEKS